MVADGENTLEIQVRRRSYVPRFSRRAVLRALGLPVNAHYSAAHSVLKHLIIRARRENDLKEAAFLSEVKAFCAKKLRRECQVCGVTVGAGNQRCLLHANFELTRAKTKPKGERKYFSAERICPGCNRLKKTSSENAKCSTCTLRNVLIPIRAAMGEKYIFRV